MKLCIFGAGAIGGHLAVRLGAVGGHQISLVARGAHLDAIRRDGLTLRDGDGDGDTCFHPHIATDRPDALEPQDLVIITLKAHALAGVAERVGRLLTPDGHALFITNGLPWWWNHGLGAACPDSPPLASLEDRIAQEINPARVIGGVAYSANRIIRPGLIVHDSHNDWILGEPDGQTTARLSCTVDLFVAAGLNARPSPDLAHHPAQAVVQCLQQSDQRPYPPCPE
ncbi:MULTISPECIES: ketopantoate reductase family protein [unclassified Sphingobium]|uniref:ketopantoate reductase family protein n=1 Tax=unclassified Sphingobium TaxID=2611147 RepID=UPI000D154B94|nr:MULTISPECIES: 2-dehydropantoate 2-reductase N-terminal domain-containing protein [unclassified Sphingobium]MBG6119950.1 ketopantoate reductase [Sphingobium sp. JAI105]PSO11883.1 hypothetical protein C7E20_10575 [Sphingobium sp. AEW4]TWC99611.1 ketopantoate reductase PanE/ApbA-like protein [Sphingobium sp. AEW010]TWD18952.1 ketopantoate reductase PanE/ApbA-like protein [Sphingobium sp. AEW013]TWD21823.1 ketopantoate reductase PanE/ApbA-like protein [Sphingobium sp. AEW001]